MGGFSALGLLLVANVANAQSYSQVSKATYTPTGKPDRVFDPSNDLVDYDYDALDRLEVETDPTGRKTQYHYAPNSDIIGVTSAAHVSTQKVRRYSRDHIMPGVVGRLRQAKGIAGNPSVNQNSDSWDTIYEYDAFQRPYKIIYPDNSYEQFGYDAQ